MKAKNEGVKYMKDDGDWMATINISGKRIYLGRYKNINDAIEARKAANIKYGFHENHGKPKVAA